MKKSMVLCAGICAVLAFASCSGSKESAYKKAYLKAQAKQEQPAEQPVQEEAPVVAPLVEKPANETTVIDNTGQCDCTHRGLPADQRSRSQQLQRCGRIVRR